MSKAVMAECLEEATDLLAKMFPDSPESLDPMVIVAVALYQERMRHVVPTYGYPVVQITPAVEPSTTWGSRA